MDEIKKVSVVLCTYNGEKYIREQLDSILNQTYPIYEIIISDDCSTDSTISIVKEYAILNENIKVFCNKSNLGVANNFQKGLFKATGDYIAISDQDDIWMDNKVELLVSSIENDYLIVADSYLCDSGIDIKKLNPMLKKMRTENFLLPARAVSLQITLSGHDMLIDKRLLNYIPSIFWKSYWYDFCITITAIGLDKIKHINFYLTIWRRHRLAYTYTEERVNIISLFLNLMRCVFSKSVKRKVMKFYAIMEQLNWRNKNVYRFVQLMANGYFFKASMFVIKHKKDFVDLKKGNKLRIFFRSIFVPFLACRNVIDWNMMYISEE